MLLLTQSITALLSFLLSFCTALFLIRKHRRFNYFILLLLAVVLIIFIYYALEDNRFVYHYYLMRKNSIAGHAHSMTIFSTFEWYNYVVGGIQKYTFESDLVNMLGRGGFLLLAIYILIIISNIFRLVRIIRLKGSPTALWKGALIFQISYLISSVNLPCSLMFYLFLLFNLIICMSTFTKIIVEGEMEEMISLLGTYKKGVFKK